MPFIQKGKAHYRMVKQWNYCLFAKKQGEVLPDHVKQRAEVLLTSLVQEQGGGAAVLTDPGAPLQLLTKAQRDSLTHYPAQRPDCLVFQVGISLDLAWRAQENSSKSVTRHVRALAIQMQSAQGQFLIL